MHRRAFQGLKRTFMLLSGLPPPYIDIKLIYKVFDFIIKIWWGRPETCINVLSGLPPSYFDRKTIYEVFGFIIKIWWGKT